MDGCERREVTAVLESDDWVEWNRQTGKDDVRDERVKARFRGL